MQEVEFDASQWAHPADIYRGFAKAFQFRFGAGCSYDAFVDCLIWDHANDLNPPAYDIVVHNVGRAPQGVQDQLRLIEETLPESLADFAMRKGRAFPIRFRLID